MILESAWLLPCYGLVGAFITLPWSLRLVRRTGPRPAAYLNMLMTAIALVHSCLLLNSTWGQPAREISFSWFQAFDLNLVCSFNISSISAGASVMIATMIIMMNIY